MATFLSFSGKMLILLSNNHATFNTNCANGKRKQRLRIQICQDEQLHGGDCEVPLHPAPKENREAQVRTKWTIMH